MHHAFRLNQEACERSTRRKSSRRHRRRAAWGISHCQPAYNSCWAAERAGDDALCNGREWTRIHPISIWQCDGGTLSTGRAIQFFHSKRHDGAAAARAGRAREEKKKWKLTGKVRYFCCKEKKRSPPNKPDYNREAILEIWIIQTAYLTKSINL